MATAKLILDGKEYELSVIEGTEGEKAIDISNLRNQTGYITMDTGYANTGSCKSAITFIDGEKGILRYRGYDIEDLAANARFPEVAYLLIYNHLPNQAELSEWRRQLTLHSLVHESMLNFFDHFPPTAHPMSILSAMVASLPAFYPDMDNVDVNIMRVLAKAKTIAAISYKKSIGEPVVYPRTDYSYMANFLRMMFATPAEPYEVSEVLENALNLLLIVHADHEQNCSTSTVRMVGSSQASLFASISAGICALSGPLHGGANQAVIEMLEKIHKDGGDYKKYVNMAKDKTSNFRLMGFGHRVYKNFDPRAKILKKACDEVLAQLGVKDPLLDIAKNLEEIALSDEFFIERKLYPNVDFYSGILYRAIGIPTNMFTVMFALGRIPGWIAHWKEMHEDPSLKIHRPRQIYTGHRKREFVPVWQRP
ncbi:MAG TPA: citrate synthase [Candidatus Hydrogenedentes bacterium]|nr:citrate synthase [Candidatus Hydrogenedentota bacterium]HPO85990.1 citrate synthase [Candidatus Hydrogenedentota bacterium]